MRRYQSRKKSRCEICRIRFHPNPRLGKRQKTCGEQKCQKAHRARYRRQYRKANRKIDWEYQAKRKDNRPPDYWKKYRDEHPDYVIRNRAASRLRRRLAKQGLQRQLDIVQVIEFPKRFETFRRFATSHRSLLQECFVIAPAIGKEIRPDPP